MNAENIAAGMRTVDHLSVYFEELKEAALRLVERGSAGQRGYFSPEEDEEVRSLLVSYWQSRCALLELIASFREEAGRENEDRPAAFLVAFAAAVLLVDAARFMREQFHDRPVVRRKLNEPAPQFGIPAGSYDHVQRSLVGARHAWHLYHAVRYFEEKESSLRAVAADRALAPALAIIDRLRCRLDVSLAEFYRTRLRVRAHRVVQHSVRGLLGRALYGLQKLSMGMLADVYVRPGHRPHLPSEIVEQLQNTLSPGDILIVRKEFALTNYFLPGYWPHVALYLGEAGELARLGIDSLEQVKPRWAKLLDRGGEPRRVLESMKDGVHIRSLASPLSCDSLVVLRSQLSKDDIAEALVRGIVHEGKPYDFDFDFGRADRLVCTEVVYRAYDGVGDVNIELTRRAGRPTLSGGDLIGMARRHEHFTPIAVFAPAFAPGLVSGDQADKVLDEAGIS